MFQQAHRPPLLYKDSWLTCKCAVITRNTSRYKQTGPGDASTFGISFTNVGVFNSKPWVCCGHSPSPVTTCHVTPTNSVPKTRNLPSSPGEWRISVMVYTTTDGTVTRSERGQSSEQHKRRIIERCFVRPDVMRHPWELPCRPPNRLICIILILKYKCSALFTCISEWLRS